MSRTDLSLLWPDFSQRPNAADLDAYLPADMNIAPLIRALCIHPSYERSVRSLMLNLCQDVEVIRYRQAVLSDLRKYPELALGFARILESIQDLESYLTTPQWRDNALRQVAWRLSELKNYLDCVEHLASILNVPDLHLESAALLRLQSQVDVILRDETIARLREELPDLLPRLRGVGSITIGINLDDEMRPLSATLLSANPYRYSEQSLLGRIFGQAPELTSPMPLHDARQINARGIQFEVELNDRNSPFMPPLFRDLATLLEETSRPVVQALKQYTQISSRFLVALKDEIAFYLGALRLIERMEASGLVLAEPEILPAEVRRTQLQGLYNINLALQRLGSAAGEIVRNSLNFDEMGRIFILTGPNQGGKTTYTQALGLAQMMAQAGLPVPAESAQMSLVDGIYTHFATEEAPEQEAGRLGEEARRLNSIFERATRHSLILLNESLASTSASESLHLAQALVRVMRVMGARAIFATHLHDLAADCERINAENPGDSRVISVVSLVEIEEGEDASVRRTYRIQPGPPNTQSYGLELAARYGISYEQLTALLRKRQVLQEPASHNGDGAGHTD